MITQNLEWIENECNQFRARFDTYSYLWTEDEQVSFNRFLDENEPKDEDGKGGDDDEGYNSEKQNPLLKGCRAKIPNLDLFDEKITHLKAIQ